MRRTTRPKGVIVRLLAPCSGGDQLLIRTDDKQVY